MTNDSILLCRALDFAARRHADQRRKGAAQEPYINHLAEVALLLAEATEGSDINLVIAGLLHDCIEDQGVLYAEVADTFGADVANLVTEVTDDKSIPKMERKQKQIDDAPSKSDRAKMLKIADKIANLNSLAISPPSDWDLVRRQQYFEWAREVVAGCRGVSISLDAKFDDIYRSGVNKNAAPQ